MTKLDSVLKSRDITWQTEVCIVKAVVFPVVTYRCKSWTKIKLSTEELIISNCGAEEDSWESLGLQRSNQSILKKINPEYSLEGLMLNSNTWATWWEELTHWKRSWCWERTRAGGERGDRVWDGCMASWTQWTWVWAKSVRWWRTGKPSLLQFMGSQRICHNLASK